ncbi:MAG: leucine-rich repeat domain-containing protein [Mycoplasmoidaceae bacterium]|nr:leucine-rich repeat domain-containing protein [Mycoplasmoidaceae bacterium]
MKNKLLKTLTCFASISAIGSTIAITSTSCGCSNSTSNILPKNVYDIQDNVLMGFKDDFLNNPKSEIYQDNFKDCDTMLIPANVTSVNEDAFIISTLPFTYETIIPSFIKNLTFAKNSNCSSIGERAFYKSSLNSVILPNSLITIQDSVFEGCSVLTSVDFSNCANLSSIGC